MSDRRRFRLRLSTAARVTLVAGLVGIMLAGGFAYWIRHEVYTSRYQLTEQTARENLQDIVRDSMAKRTLRSQAGVGPAYEIVDSNGWIAGTNEGLLAYQGNGPILPAPPRGAVQEPFAVRVELGNYDASRSVCGRGHFPDESCDQDRRLAGREVKAWRTIVPLSRIYPPDSVAADRTAAFSVLVLPFEAEAAVADLDRVLRPALPLAVVLTMLGAYLGTRTALRPVERMRVRAAEISARNLHERVPVPPTGDVVARLATTLNDTLGRLERAADRQRGFVTDAAHELRSPIASLRAILEVAHAHPERADWARAGAAAVDEIRRLQTLAEDLLLVARLDAEPGTAREPVDLAEVVRRQLARRVDEGPELTFESVETAMVLGDAGQLDRLVGNLLDNAMRHARSAVAVRIEQQDGQVTLHVDDDGGGIPVPDRERVFERFARLDEARSRDAGGVGLGLAIAREIAVRHDGRLTVGDSPDGGARFTLVLKEARNVVGGNCGGAGRAGGEGSAGVSAGHATGAVRGVRGGDRCRGAGEV